MTPSKSAIEGLRLHEATFRAFGSQCRITCDLEPAVAAAVHRLEDLERRWSRFMPESEISRLNANDGKPFEVSAITAELLERSRLAMDLTKGAFNPLQLRQLEAWGYDRSYEMIADRSRHDVASGVFPSDDSPELIVSDGYVRISAGAAFDPGGIGKGFAADVVLEDMISAGATWALVSLGGDMAIGGSAIEAYGLTVHVEDPWTPGAAFGALTVRGGGVATSSTRSRRWLGDGEVVHHLLDSKSGRPAESPRVSSTVHAASGWLADVLAKVCLIEELTESQLREFGATGLAFDAAGHRSLGLEVDQISHPEAA